MTTSYLSSFNGLFLLQEDGKTLIERIEIPINQRDYAQGRTSDAVNRIRASFLDALYDGLVSDKPASLDFVYGDMEKGTLKPLDGQQRLTTLFLLHWYLGWRAERLDQQQGWKQFSYATRSSARSFCKRLTESNPPVAVGLRGWITDQSWYQHAWRYDPTIQSMLVMLEALDARFKGIDYSRAWNKLMDKEKPAISFHILPNSQMGLSEDTYIKMNSRGKPLTPFENFKAFFEKLLEDNGHTRVDEFARKMDVEWTDVLWKFRSPSNIVDAELLDYWEYVTQLCAWRNGALPSGDHRMLAKAIYGRDNAASAANLDFVMDCFDTWCGVDIASYFEQFFLLKPVPVESDDTSHVVLYAGAAGGTNLFLARCRDGEKSTLAQALFLYAVLLHRLNETEEFPRRLRILRNLIEASNFNLRREDMPRFVKDVETLIIEGKVGDLRAFYQPQVKEELLKLEGLSGPDLEKTLFHLEDHDLLRGALGAFDLDPAVFPSRAHAFHRVFQSAGHLQRASAALLAAGDYGKRSSNRFLQLGSTKHRAYWSPDVFSIVGRYDVGPIRRALGEVLDAVERHDNVAAALLDCSNRYLARGAEEGRDWRWYLVRYDVMRDGPSGIYAYTGGVPAFDLCMLDKTVMRSHYRDPFLSAICSEAKVSMWEVNGNVLSKGQNGPWFTGYETDPRRMRLVKSGIEVQCVQVGFALFVPENLPLAQKQAFSRICEAFAISEDRILHVPQTAVEDTLLDTEDRVALGAKLLAQLVEAEL
jgi:hypothetical protein